MATTTDEGISLVPGSTNAATASVRSDLLTIDRRWAEFTSLANALKAQKAAAATDSNSVSYNAGYSQLISNLSKQQRVVNEIVLSEFRLEGRIQQQQRDLEFLKATAASSTSDLHKRQLDERIDELTSSETSLKLRLAAKERECTDLMQTVGQQREEISSMGLQINQMHMKEMVDPTRHAQSYDDDARPEGARAEEPTDVHELQMALKQCTQRNAALMKSESRTQQRISALEADFQRVSYLLQLANDAKEAGSSSNSTAHGDNQVVVKLQQELKDAISSNSGLQSRLSELELDLQTATADSSSKSQSGSDKGVVEPGSHEAEVRELRGRIDELSASLQDAETSLKDAHASNAAMAAQITNQPADLVKFKAEVVKMKESLKVQVANFSALSKLNQKQKKSKAETSELKSRLAHVATDLANKTEELSAAEASLAQAHAKCEVLTQQLADSEKREAKMKQLVQNSITSQSCLISTQAELTAAQNKLATLTQTAKELETMTGTCAALETQLAKQKQMAQHALDRARSLQTQLNSSKEAQARSQQLEATVADLTAQLAEMKLVHTSQTMTAEESRQDLDEELQALKASAAQWQHAAEQAQTDHRAADAQLRSVKAQQQADKRELNSALARLSAREEADSVGQLEAQLHSVLQQENDTLRAAQQDLQAMLAKQEEDSAALRQANREAKAQVQQLKLDQLQVEKLKGQLSKAEAQLVACRAAEQQQQRDSSSQASKHRSLTQEHQVLLQSHQSVKTKLLNTQAQLRTANGALAHAKAEATAANNKVKYLEGQLAEAREELKLSSSSSTSSSRGDSTDSKVSALRTQLATLEARWAEDIANKSTVNKTLTEAYNKAATTAAAKESELAAAQCLVQDLHSQQRLDQQAAEEREAQLRSEVASAKFDLASEQSERARLSEQVVTLAAAVSQAQEEGKQQEARATYFETQHTRLLASEREIQQSLAATSDSLAQARLSLQQREEQLSARPAGSTDAELICQIDQLEAALAEQSEENRQYKLQLSSMGSELLMSEQLIKQANVLSETESKLATREVELANVQKQLKESTQTVLDLTSKLTNLDSKIEESERRLIDQLKQSKAEKAALTQQLAQQSSKQQLQHKEEEVRRLDEENKRLHDFAAETQAILRKENVHLAGRLHKLQREVEQSKQEATELRTAVAAAQRTGKSKNQKQQPAPDMSLFVKREDHEKLAAELKQAEVKIDNLVEDHTLATQQLIEYKLKWAQSQMQ